MSFDGRPAPKNSSKSSQMHAGVSCFDLGGPLSLFGFVLRAFIQAFGTWRVCWQRSVWSTSFLCVVGMC